MTAAGDVRRRNDDRLILMANQIARNFATLGNEAAAAATADHLLSFWDPRMKARIGLLLHDRRGDFSEIACHAIRRLPAGPIVPQTQATEFNRVDQDGRSDAG